jgi:hypothetical protein
MIENSAYRKEKAMSKCISSEGEYSEHELGTDEPEFVCARCFVFNEDAAVAEIARLRAVLASREAESEWEYAFRDDGGHVWPFGMRDEEEGTTLAEIEEIRREDWWNSETEGSTLHRRRPATPPGPWEPVPSPTEQAADDWTDHPEEHGSSDGESNA